MITVDNDSIVVTLNLCIRWYLFGLLQYVVRTLVANKEHIKRSINVVSSSASILLAG